MYFNSNYILFELQLLGS